MARFAFTVAAAFLTAGLLAVGGRTAVAPPPQITIVSGPEQLSHSGTATFEFTVDPEQALRCFLDGKESPQGVCASPQTYTALENGKHLFVVQRFQSDSLGSGAQRWGWVVDVPPPQAEITGGPSGTVTERTATFTFDADQENATFECRLGEGDWAQCESPVATPELALGGHSFDVRATTAYGTGPAASRTWAVAPDTRITAGPSGRVQARDATFAFVSDPAGGSFECSLDGGDFVPCSSQRDYAALGLGEHRFRVRAVAGEFADPSPEERSWTIVAPPQTRLTSTPEPTTTARRAGIGFRSVPDGASFECSLDGRAFAPCRPPVRTRRLALGVHAFRVRAVAGGLRDPSPARVEWTVTAVAVPPDTVITSAPGAETRDRSASMEFESRPPGATFECSLDGGPFQPCASGEQLADLALGAHLLLVRAVLAGLADPTPGRVEWRVLPPRKHWALVGGAGGAAALLGAGGLLLFRRQRLRVRLRLRPLELEASDAEPPESCRARETYTWRRECKLKPALRRFERLRVTAFGGDGDTADASLDGEPVERLDRAVRARRLRRRARVEALVAPVAEQLVAELERMLAGHPGRADVEVEAELKGGKLECEFQHYACVPKDEGYGWEKLGKWTSEVEHASSEPVTRLAWPVEREECVRRLRADLLVLVERVALHRRRARAPEAPPVPHP